MVVFRKDKKVTINRWNRNSIQASLKYILKSVYPIIFFLNVFANVIAYYVTFGNQVDFARKLISWGIMAIYFCVSSGYFIFCVKDKKKYILVFTFIILILVELGASLVINGADMARIRQIILLLIEGFPAVIFAIYAVHENLGVNFFSGFVWIGLIMVPWYILFSIHFITADISSPGWNMFGGMIYLYPGYTAMFIVQGILIAAFYGEKKSKKIQMLQVVVVFVCTLAATCSGSRGVLVGMMVCTIVWFPIAFWRKQRERSFIFYPCMIMTIIVCFLVFIPFNNARASRFKQFYNEVADGTLKEALNSEESNMVLKDLNESIDSGKGIFGMLEEKALSAEPDDIKETERLEKSITNGSMARVFLYKMALHEIRQHPILGLGGGGYTYKYQTYPHNLILEIIVDFGIPIGGSCIIYVLVCVLRTVKKKWNDETKAIILFCISLCVEMMLSGSLYASPSLLWLAAYFHMSATVRAENRGSSDKKVEKNWINSTIHI